MRVNNNDIKTNIQGRDGGNFEFSTLDFFLIARNSDLARAAGWTGNDLATGDLQKNLVN